MAETILVADDDPAILRLVEINLKLKGFDVLTASDGEEALRMVHEQTPALVLLDIMMPKMNGYDVCERIRADGRIRHINVIMLTAKSLSADKIVGLTAGADDYVLKPFDPMELVARVKSTLRRSREMRAISPLTGLPGNVQIEEEIRHSFSAGEPFAVCYADLDNFKGYNDRYGFLQGDRAIVYTANTLREVAESFPGSFVGHVGGDDFVAVVPPEVAEDIAKRIVERFDAGIEQFYEREDVERGYVEVEDRKGVLQKLPLVGVSVGIATTQVRRFAHYGEAVSVATEMKQFAKREPRSSYAVDRRTPA